MSHRNCPFCKEESEFQHLEYKNTYSMFYSCPHCGSFEIKADDIVERIYGDKTLVDQNMYLLRCYLGNTRDVHNENNPINLTVEEIKRIIETEVPHTVDEKIERLLRYLNDRSSYFGEKVELDKEVVFSKIEKEFSSIISEMTSNDWIKASSIMDDGTFASITLDGIAFLKKASENVRKDSCFIAMWFGEDMNEAYSKCIEPACLAAGYRPIRVDQENFNGDITDRIIGSIRTTHFTIADMTGYRGGVYYEAGFAKGLSKQVILTCRKDWFDGDPKKNMKVHFDLTHENFIVWDPTHLEDFKQRLTDRIIATIGIGEYKESRV